MKTYSYLLSAMLITALSVVVASCNKDQRDTPAQPLPKAKVTSIEHYEKAKMTAYNIEYPSLDPYGNPVTLSGSITVGDEVNADTPALGVALINHFTVYQKNQCPSKGELAVQKFAVGTQLVAVSADYYGFGCTEDKHQAYCIGSANAQASIDCLLAARELFPSLNIKIDPETDYLFNLGYSQGGQTSIAVEKMVAEKYPGIKITHTFAGGGPYDMTATYKEMKEKDLSGMPSTIISVILSFNEFYQLGFPREKLLRGDALAHVDDWILSKDLTREEIDEKVGSLKFSNFASEDIQNMDSEVSKKLMAALEKENLAKNWTPAKDAHISLIHHIDDITVPVVNQDLLYDYLANTVGMDGEHLEKFVAKRYWMKDMPAHENGAVDFAIDIFLTLNMTYDVPFHPNTDLIMDLIKGLDF